MLLIISSTFLISLTISMLMSSSPLTSGFWVLLIALMTAGSMGVTFNSWFAIIIFLIYIGGMLVMFAYFSALTPNKPLNMHPLKTTLITANLIMLSILTMPHNNILSLITPYNQNPSSIMILFSPSNCILLLTMASILFLILVTVVKIANILMGPLRPFMYVQTNP